MFDEYLKNILSNVDIIPQSSNLSCKLDRLTDILYCHETIDDMSEQCIESNPPTPAQQLLLNNILKDVEPKQKTITDFFKSSSSPYNTSNNGPRTQSRSTNFRSYYYSCNRSIRKTHTRIELLCSHCGKTTNQEIEIRFVKSDST